MALNAATLSTNIRNALLANAASQASDNPALTAMCDAIAQAVVQHIVSAGLVTVITTCPAGGGTGSGAVT